MAVAVKRAASSLLIASVGVRRTTSKHSVSAVAHSGEVAAASGGTGRTHQGEFDSLTARSAHSGSRGLMPSELGNTIPLNFHGSVAVPIDLFDDTTCWVAHTVPPRNCPNSGEKIDPHGSQQAKKSKWRMNSQ